MVSSPQDSPGPRGQHVDVLVVGAGFSGLYLLHRLRGAGFNVRVLDKAADIGGTWYWNRYPGARCDVESMQYAFSFCPELEQEWVWTEKYATQPEILHYANHVADRFDLRPDIQLNTTVLSATYDEDHQRWSVELDGGGQMSADFCVMATGCLSTTNTPDFNGLDTFTGPVYHTGQWPHEEVDFSGQRVGIIGTGSSAVQTVGAVVEEVESLSLFQRTAQWVLPQDNPPYTDEEKAAFRADPDSQRRLRDEISELFADGFANAVVDAESPVLARIAELCQANLDSVVDKELRERLTPDHRVACKRLVISENFYEAIQHPNARLVTNKIDRIVSDGVLTSDGEVHQLDVLVLATGFQVDRFMRPMEIVGPVGTRLSEAWADRPTAYLSMAIPGLPNLFMLNGPNGPVGNFSLIEVAELQMEYALQLVDQIANGSYRLIEPTPGATKAEEEARTEAAGRTVWATGCNSWYLDDRGVPMVWPWTFREFQRRMAAPDLDHYTLTE